MFKGIGLASAIVVGCLSVQASFAEDNPAPSESTSAIKAQERSLDDTTWGFGISYGLLQDVGLSLFERLNANWTVQLDLDWNNNCCGYGGIGGGNPSQGTPYGWTYQSSQRDRLAIVLDRSFGLNSKRTWLLLAGAGVGFEETRSRVEFYNQTSFGFDLNSPAGSQSIYQKRFVLPGRLGIQRTDFRIFGQPSAASIYYDFALNGPARSPTYTTPNGQAVKGDDWTYQDSMFKIDVAMFY